MNLSPISTLATGQASAAAPIAPARTATPETSTFPKTRKTDTPAPGVADTTGVIRPADRKQLDEAVAALNKFIKPLNSAIEFSIDEDSGRTLVKVVDTETNDVLRQFPSKEALAISQSLDKFSGLLVREQV